MAKFVNVASVLFEKEYLSGQPNAGELVLRDTAEKLNSLKGRGLDLVVLSEGIESVGIAMADAEAIDQPGPYLELYANFARSEQCYVAGSVKLREGDAVHNSIAFVGPDGAVLDAYHKSNLTEGEQASGLTPGRGAVVVDTDIGRLGGAICFDLNFEWLRKDYAARKPDILVFASMYHGGFVQRMWAYECRSFFVASLPFHGGAIINPLGTPLATTHCYANVARARINLDRVVVHLDYNREKFPAMQKQYGDEIEIDIPRDIGSALIYSVSPDRTAADIASEHDLLLLDDYFARSLNMNRGDNYA